MTESVRRRLIRRLWYLPVLALLFGAALLLPGEVLPTSAPPEEATLILDAGHGGADGGAVASDGTKESEINLDIALRANAIAAFWGIPTRMTRTSETISYPVEAQTISAMKKADQQQRLALLHETPNAILISIHQNYYPASSPNGIQVFYAASEESKRLGELTQQNLTGCLAPENHRIAEPIRDSIYLMKNAGCTAILAECGFLSNPEELRELKSPEYRLSLAAVLIASYLQYTRGMDT